MFLAAIAYLLVNVVSYRASEVENVPEYCHFETFRASCPDGQLILMQSAFYGRKSLGRCVRTNFGFIGCYSDVLEFLDRRCSARRSCELEVIEPNFDDIRPCNVELKSYLEAQYTCLTVASDITGSCEVSLLHRHPVALPRPEALLHCGSEISPWILRVPSGQRINITLFEFSSFSSSSASSSSVSTSSTFLTTPSSTSSGISLPARPSVLFARVRETWPVGAGETVDVRAFLNPSTVTRETHVHTTLSNSVEVTLNGSGKDEFLLTFAAIGCPDVQTSPDMAVHYSGDRNTAKVVCKNSEQSWRLVCTERGWHGYTGNCTTQLAKIQSLPPNHFSHLKTSTAMVASIVVGVSVTISLCVLVLGLLILKRFKGPSVALTGGQSDHTDQLVQLSCAQDASSSSVIDCSNSSCPHSHPSFHHLLPASVYAGAAVKRVDIPTMLTTTPPVSSSLLHRSLAPPHDDLIGAPVGPGPDCPYSLLRLSQRPFVDCLCRHPVREPCRGSVAITDWDRQRLAGQPSACTVPKDRYRTMGAAAVGPCSDVETERLVSEGCPECNAMKAELQNNVLL